MIKRRRIEDLKVGDCGLSYVNLDLYPDSGGVTNSRFKDGKLYVETEDDWDVETEDDWVDPTGYRFWIFYDDIKLNITEE